MFLNLGIVVITKCVPVFFALFVFFGITVEIVK